MLRDDLHGEMIFQYLYGGMIAYCLHEAALYLSSCVVGMMQDTELRVTSLAVQVICPILLLIEVHAPLHQVLDTFGSIAHHLFHCRGVADVVARYHRVLYVLFEVIHQQVGHSRYASLSLGCVGILECGLAHQGNFSLARICHFERITHSSHSASYNQEIKFAYHDAIDI